jgi:hypothetical protein
LVLISGEPGNPKHLGGEPHTRGYAICALGAVFVVMPVAYVGGATGAVLMGIFMQSYADEWRFLVPSITFIGVQFAVIGMFLPRRVSALHHLGRYGAVAMCAIPLVLAAANIQFDLIPRYKEQYREFKVGQEIKMEKPMIKETKFRVFWPILHHQNLVA